MQDADIVKQAEEIAGDYLSLVEMLAVTKQFQADNQSRLVCRCPSCKSARSRNLLWVQSMRSAHVPKPAEPAAPAATVPEHSTEGIALD